MGTKFWIDVCRCFNNECFNPSHVFEIFAQYSGVNPKTLCKQILEIVKEEKDIWDHVATVALQFKFMSFDYLV